MNAVLMTKSQFMSAIRFLIAISCLISGGCATKLTFTSIPTGEPVYFRNASEWVKQGVTPCEAEMSEPYDRSVALIGWPYSPNAVVINLKPTKNNARGNTGAIVSASGVIIAIMEGIGNSMGGSLLGMGVAASGLLITDSSHEYSQTRFHVVLPGKSQDVSILHEPMETSRVPRGDAKADAEPATQTDWDGPKVDAKPPTPTP